MPEIRDISAHQRLGLLDLARFSAARNITAKRDIERAGTRYLLDQLLRGESYELKYTGHNKPYLEGRKEKISISHSHDMLAVMCDSRAETGVDVELLREKVLRIRHKFLNDAEYAFAGEDVAKLITIWAAKEAMYKVYGRKQLDFRTQMAVAPFNGDELTGTLSATDEMKKFLMRRERLGEYMLVYILHEIQHAHQEA